MQGQLQILCQAIGSGQPLPSNIQYQQLRTCLQCWCGGGQQQGCGGGSVNKNVDGGFNGGSGGSYNGRGGG